MGQFASTFSLSDHRPKNPLADLVLDDSTVDPQIKEKRIAIIGSGCAGLAAAWHLNRCGISVTIFESSEKLGGHANTVRGLLFLILFFVT
jgi:NADPH-dependent 2,4-dienoyl-CoA reductase/sulfur reductase-like enzyme